MIDIPHLLSDFHIPYEQTSRYVNTVCPFCEDGKFHMGIAVDGSHSTCFKCGLRPIEETLTRILSLPYTQIKKLLKEYESHTTIVRRMREKRYEGKVKLPGTTSRPFSKAEEKYLLSRHFDPDTLHEKNKIYGGGITGEFAYRIIIPFYENGKLLTYIGRSISKKIEPRYFNLSIEKSIASAKELLFNIDNAASRTGIVCEGPMDALRLGDNAVSLQGIKFTSKQVNKIRKFFDRVIIMFDNEPAAQSQAKKLLNLLESIGVQTEISNALKHYGKKDPGELSPRMVQEIKAYYRV